MKHLLLLPLLSMAALLFTSCSNNGSGSGMADNTGPFDAAGNYRDDWADDPTKWRRKPSTQIASNDLPPADASPIDRSSPPVRATSSPPTRATSSPPTRATSSPTTTARTQSAPKPKPTVAYKPKPKPKPKAKPTPSRYMVKKGDSLYVIAQRNRTSVAALQKANNISGTLIRPGQALVIPRR